MGAFPVPSSVAVSSSVLGEVPAIELLPASVASGKTILYFHGGGFTAGSARGFSGLVASLADFAEARAVVVDYRLAPETVFPGPCDDAFQSYSALIERGVRPADIVITADSAGASLALAAVFEAKHSSLPLPGGLAFFCPWLDLSLGSGSVVSKADEDLFLSRAMLEGAATMYLSGRSANAPKASPLLADFAGLPPMLIQAASADILLDDSLRLAARAAHAGVAVELQVWPNMLHVWHAFSPHLDEGLSALRRAADFIAKT